ncbi:MAG: putative sensor domain DACNV-containing protein [Gemmatimonadaceae bacterium]
MTAPAYPAARVVAARVEAHFARHLATARERGDADLAPLPDARAVEAILDAAFWASLRREEDYAPTISLAFVSPEQVSRPLRFERRLRLLPVSLARLAPAVERPGIHLGVWRDGDELHVWGATRTLPALCFVLEVIAPGLLVIKHRRGEHAGKFVNVAVLEGDRVKIVDERGTILPGCPPVLHSLLTPGSAASPDDDSMNVPLQLAVSIRAHRRGGALLVVPAGSAAWRESIVRPVSYSLVPTRSDVADLVRCDPAERARVEWQESLRRAVDALAGLTAVDGATVIGDQYELLAFGAKLRRRDGWDEVEQVLVTEPIEGATNATVDPAELGGTRHLSAAQFVHDQRDAVALVASQDGRFTIFAWSPTEGIVRAHRIEVLLM